jgi:hypothetical protein
MTPASSYRRRTVLLLLTFAVLALAVYWVLAGSPPEPQRDHTTLQGVPVTVEYSRSASPDDLMLPFHPGAEVERSFSYLVKADDGMAVTRYAFAALNTPDAPDEVADAYRAQLPGNPEPELLEDQRGKRLVLAVGDDDEVRKVTITAREEGSHIELVRTTRPIMPRRAPTPRLPHETPA